MTVINMKKEPEQIAPDYPEPMIHGPKVRELRKLQTYLGTPSNPVGIQEFNSFWKELTEDEKDAYSEYASTELNSFAKQVSHD